MHVGLGGEKFDFSWTRSWMLGRFYLPELWGLMWLLSTEYLDKKYDILILVLNYTITKLKILVLIKFGSKSLIYEKHMKNKFKRSWSKLSYIL